MAPKGVDCERSVLRRHTSQLFMHTADGFRPGLPHSRPLWSALWADCVLAAVDCLVPMLPRILCSSLPSCSEAGCQGAGHQGRKVGEEGQLQEDQEAPLLRGLPPTQDPGAHPCPQVPAQEVHRHAHIHTLGSTFPSAGSSMAHWWSWQRHGSSSGSSGLPWGEQQPTHCGGMGAQRDPSCRHHESLKQKYI
eukprot:1161442-Pelagomonas_calceolata.AAC.6